MTVSFSCTDTTSGIATCSAPSTVATDGANQSVTGTAVDRAGNTATLAVRVNLDQTPPLLLATVTPVANAQGWHRSNPTVTFTATDSVSGVATVSPAVVVTTEGMGQRITGTARVASHGPDGAVSSHR